MHKRHIPAFYAYFYLEGLCRKYGKLITCGSFYLLKKSYIIDLLFRLRYDNLALYFFKYLLMGKVDNVKILVFP